MAILLNLVKLCIFGQIKRIGLLILHSISTSVTSTNQHVCSFPAVNQHVCYFLTDGRSGRHDSGDGNDGTAGSRDKCECSHTSLLRHT